MDGLITALNTGVSSMATDLTGAMASAAPVLLPIAGGLIAIGVILKVVHRVTGK